jgi:hypothetical protein
MVDGVSRVIQYWILQLVLYVKTKVIAKTHVNSMEQEVTGSLLPCTARLVNLLKMGVKRQYSI